MTAYPIVRLEATGLDPLVLDRENGWIGQRLDLGDAETRVVAEDAPDADGTLDTTTLTGARTVTLGIILAPGTSTVWAMRQRLRAFTSARLRPTMFVTMAADAPEQRITLRRGPLTDIVDVLTIADVTVQWVAPLGVLESAELHTAIAAAAGAGAEAGRGYNLTFDRTYPASPVLGTAEVVNAGNAHAYPIIRIYGPCTNPVITNVTQSRGLSFTSLTINAGEFLEIDTRNKTIRYNGLASDSRYHRLVFPTSKWPTVQPGANTFRFTPATSSVPSQAQIEWRDSWL